MRVVVAIFLIGGLVIAVAFLAGSVPAPQAPSAAMSALGPSAQPSSRPAPQPVCSPGSGPTEIAPVPPGVRARVDAAWSRIEGWLAESLTTEVVWNPPAADAAISRAQRAAGAAFPPDLVASLRRHDGVRAAGFTFPPFYAPMSTGEIGADAGKLCAATAGWDGSHIPFARDSGGWYLYLDSSGAVGEHAPGGPGDAAAGSLADLLDRTADMLEGRRTDRYFPSIGADGVLGWRLR
ncbi:SMI1/KNR4 family protein [Actinokineospora guangxiensis]|uniref:SMI1/KNR4 family protein n=1 Tax=Actinokineospora guangxiensis TaxID=1490288 RepID=UPI003672272F